MNLPAFQGQGDKSAKSGGYTLGKGESAADGVPQTRVGPDPAKYPADAAGSPSTTAPPEEGAARSGGKVLLGLWLFNMP